MCQKHVPGVCTCHECELFLKAEEAALTPPGFVYSPEEHCDGYGPDHYCEHGIDGSVEICEECHRGSAPPVRSLTEQVLFDLQLNPHRCEGIGLTPEDPHYCEQCVYCLMRAHRSTQVPF